MAEGSLSTGLVTAIMGPSGVGKSTLLHALCGKILRTSGQIEINGSDTLQPEGISKLVGFVPQVLLIFFFINFLSRDEVEYTYIVLFLWVLAYVYNFQCI